MKDEKKPSKSPSTKKKAGRLRRWFRRFAYLVGLLVILAALLNLILLAALPSILESQAEGYGLSCTYDRLSFSIFTSDLELWHLEVAPLEPGQPSVEAGHPAIDAGKKFVDLEYCRADLVVYQLLFGNLEVRRVEVDGMDLWIEREADGSFPLLSHFESDAPDQGETAESDLEEEAEEEVVESEDQTEKERLDLSLFFELRALRLQHVHAHFTDKTQDPWLDTRFEANIRVSHVGTKDRPVRFEVTLSSLPVLESARVEGRCSITPDKIAAAMDVAVRGFHPKTVASYLTPLGFTPYADSIAFHTRAEVDAWVNDDRPDTVRLHAETSGVRLLVDDSEAMALDRFTLDASHLNMSGADLADVLIEGVRANAIRDAKQNLCAAGFRFHAVEPKKEEFSTKPTEPAPEKSKPFRLGPPKVVIKDVEAAFVDQAVSPTANLGVVLEQLTIDPSSEGEIDPVTLAGLCLDFDGNITLPGIAKSVRLTGRADPFSPVKRVDLQVRSTGIAPDALAPYLAAAKIEPLLEDGSFACDLSAVVDQTDEQRLLAELELKDVLFSDEVPFLGLDRLGVKGVAVDSVANAIVVDELAITGSHCGVRLDVDNRLQVCGMAIPLAPAAGPDSDNASQRPTGDVDQSTESINDASGSLVESGDSSDYSPASKEDSAGSPSLCIEKLIWSENRFTFCDATRSPAQEIAISDIGFEATHVTFDPNSEDLIPEPAVLRAWFRAPGLVDSLVMKGKLSSEKQKLSFAMDVRGKGITAKTMTPYLEAVGCRPALDDGRLRLNLESSVKLEDTGIEASLALTELSFSDGKTEWLGLDALRVDSFRTGPGHPSIDRIEIAKPRARARRLDTGALEAGGFIFGLPPSGPYAATNQETELDPTAGHVEADTIKIEESEPTDDDAATETLGADAILFALNDLDLSSAEIFWNDLAVEPSVDTSLQMDFGLKNFEAGVGARPATIHAELRVPGALDAFTIQGTAEVDPEDLRAKLLFNADGMRAGPFASYLAGPIEPTLEHGIFKAEMEARWSRHEEGGNKGGVTVLDLQFRDSEDGPPLLSMSALQTRIYRLDLDDDVVALENIRLSECLVRVKQNARGDLALMGVTIPAKAETPESEAKDALVETDSPVAVSELPSVEETAAAPKPLRKWGEHPPLVTLDDFLFQVFLVAEMENPETNEIEEIETHLRLYDEGPIQLLGKEPDAHPPIKMNFLSSVHPGVGHLDMVMTAQPFAPEPLLCVDINATGIAAQPLIERIPGLSEKIDGKGLEDGLFKGQVETRLIAKRRSPLDFDLSKGFGVEFEMKGFEFRDNPDGPVLAGLEELFLDVKKIKPDSGDVHVSSLEIAKPIMHVVQDEDGMHLLGLVVKAEEKPSENSTGEDSTPEDVDPDAASAATSEDDASSDAEVAIAEPSVTDSPDALVDSTGDVTNLDNNAAETKPPEIKVDKIYLTDLDFSVQDLSVDPPMIVPLNRLDVEVRDFTSLALVEPHPVKFSVNVGSGEVPLPERSKSGGIFSALGGAVTDLAGMGEEQAMQDRLLFDEIAVSGRIVMKPELQGWVNATVSALELGSFTGVVEKSGVNLNDGLFDANVALRFRNDGSLLTKAKFDMTYLELSEPPDGLISQYLKLPAPLDVVVFLLRDEDEVISIPLDFEVGADGLSAATIAGVAASTLGSLITDAVASSPFRIVGGTLGDLVPLGDEEEEVGDQGPFMTLAFDPGDTHLNPGMMQQLDELIECLNDEEETSLLLRHELSVRDIELANRSANPSQAECLELSRRFRQDRKRLAVQRERLAAQAVAAFSAGFDRDAELALDRIRALDREAGMLEKSLDDTLTLLHAGAERRAPRRTRGACIELGLIRLEGIRKFLTDRGVINASERIKISRPRMTDAPILEMGEVQVILKGRKK